MNCKHIRVKLTVVANGTTHVLANRCGIFAVVQKGNPVKTSQDFARKIRDVVKGGNQLDFLLKPLTPNGPGQNPEASPRLKERELDRLFRGIKSIQSCLHNPHLRQRRIELAYVGPQPLTPINWALAPDHWAYLVVPDFDELAFWGEAFPNIRDRLDASPFWSHHEEFLPLAKALSSDIAEATEVLTEGDPVLRKAWSDVQSALEWTPRPSRIPSSPEPKLDARYPPWNEKSARTVVTALRNGPLPDLYQRLTALEEMLQQLNDDLLHEADT